MSVFYNRFHVKNKNIQIYPINKRNYTYQTLIRLTNKYAHKSFSVLDLGCGVGTIDFFLANKVKNIVAVDISSRAINLAKKSLLSMKLTNLKFINESIDNLNLTDEFDLIICSEVIEHITEDKKILALIKKHLKKNGIAIISTPLASAPLYRLGLLKKFDKKVGHLRRYEENELINIIELVGFKVIEIAKVEGILRNLLFTNSLIGNLLRVIRWPFSIVVNTVDTLLLSLFGASNIYIVVKK